MVRNDGAREEQLNVVFNIEEAPPKSTAIIYA